MKFAGIITSIRASPPTVHAPINAGRVSRFPRRIFDLEGAEIYQPRWYFRTVKILEETLAKDRTETRLPLRTRRQLNSLMEKHARAEIAVAETFRLNALRKSRSVQ